MRDFEKISVELPSALSAVVQSAVASGEYDSVSAVIEEALLRWTENNAIRNFSSEELNQLWKEGKASGQPRVFSMDEIIAKAKTRFEKNRVTST
jgi:antitoxin ParD1/3/4